MAIVGLLPLWVRSVSAPRSTIGRVYSRFLFARRELAGTVVDSSTGAGMPQVRIA